MKKLCLVLIMLAYVAANAQVPVVKLKKDTVTLQSPPAQPAQLQPAGTLVKEEVWAVSAGNLVTHPRSLKLFTSNDITHQLSVKFRPGFNGNKTINWSSADPSVASVTDKGFVTGKSRGSTRILAITADKRDSAICTVAVLVPNEWGNSRDAGGLVGTQQSQIYFANPKDGKKLYKMDFRGQELTKLSDDSPQNIQVMGRWIYFNCSDGIVQISIDGNLRKVIDSRASLLRVHHSGILYCTRENKVYALNLNKPNQAMEMVFEDRDPVFNFSIDQYYMFYNKYWGNEPDPLNGGAFRYNWASKKKEQLVPVHHVINKFAVEENSAILYYFQEGSNTVKLPTTAFGIEITSGGGDPVSTGMYTTTYTNKQRTEIPQIEKYTQWTLINDWVYYFNGNECRRVKAEGAMDQGVAEFDRNCELYPFGEFLLVYSSAEGKIYRMLPDGRDIKQIL
jgi:hypothetical protein